MTSTLKVILLLAAGCASTLLPAAEKSSTAGSPTAGSLKGALPLFNGRDLSGWINVNTPADTWWVEQGLIATSGEPYGFLRTDRMYENFVLELEWMHLPRTDNKPSNSGVFIWGDPIPAKGTGAYTRGIEIQILHGLEVKNAAGEYTITSDGDIFAIWGATCVPDRPHPSGWMRAIPKAQHTKPAGEWNHYRVTAIDGTVKLEVNGHEVTTVTGSSPRKGFLALEAEGNPIRFRNLQILELPSSNPKPEEVAVSGEGWNPLYDRRSLAGWKAAPGGEARWKAEDWRLVCDGAGAAAERALWSERDHGDFELVVDWRLPAKAAANGKKHTGESAVVLRGPGGQRLMIPPSGSRKEGEWNRYHVIARGNILTVKDNDTLIMDAVRVPNLAARGPIGLLAEGGGLEFANLYIRELPADRK